MESTNVMYYKYNAVEWIYCFNSTCAYPVHTHANHVLAGYVMDGMVSITLRGKERLYGAGEFYFILPDTPHAVEPLNGIAYSMINVCISGDTIPVEAGNEMRYEKKLKQIILNAPENTLLIEDMAQRVGISPYHLIRQFKADCGLTPHQFQIQCRVRKAQRLLEEGKSVTEVAYATGFCDQSHFNRCFRKIVRLTPREYKQSVKQLA